MRIADDRCPSPSTPHTIIKNGYLFRTDYGSPPLYLYSQKSSRGGCPTPYFLGASLGVVGVVAAQFFYPVAVPAAIVGVAAYSVGHLTGLLSADRSNGFVSQGIMNVEDLGNSFLKGHDRRRTISDSERFAFPNLCHGTLIARFNSREGGRTYYVGSGTLVGEQSVLTAAHLLYDLELSLAASTVSFFPGNGALPIDGSNARHVIIPETFVKREVVGGAGENNFALVTLDKPLGRHFGFMGLRAFSPEQDKEVAISGYGSYPSSTANMQGMSGKVTARSAQRFSYDIDTRAGLTGVGVCDCFPTSSYDRWNSGWRSSHHCIGVHTAGRDCFTHSNLGTIIDADKLASLMEWMKA